MREKAAVGADPSDVEPPGPAIDTGTCISGSCIGTPTACVWFCAPPAAAEADDAGCRLIFMMLTFCCTSAVETVVPDAAGEHLAVADVSASPPSAEVLG
jgi:hypothetical protein